MRNTRRFLSLLLAVIMVTSLCASFSFAATQSLDDFAITLDDETVKAVNTGTNAFTVKLPDGRPRVPQVAAADAQITQAFLPDDADSATATVVVGGQTVTITFVKDASLGFVLQYDDYYTFDPGFTAASFQSSNTSVATVSSTGEVHVVKVSDSPVTITATGSGSQSKTLTITKTIKAVLGVWMLTGQSNSAINYYDKNTAIVPKKGTALYYGWQFSGTSDSVNYSLPASFVPMTTANGKANVGSNEPSLASTLYAKSGEKILMLNGGISGTGISYFLPGCGTDAKKYTWAHTNEVFEGAYELWNSTAFKANYETRVRSYFFLQGCAEVGSAWTTHYNGFAVNKNTNSFTTLGTTYGPGKYTWHTYMTDILGFDYCFDILIAWRPVGIVTSTRTAQLKLAEDLDDYIIATRINQTFSLEEGTYRYDNLHYSQIGKNYLGQSAAAKAVATYLNTPCLEGATKATAYFNKIGYDDGEIFYVSPGDFYNYCTRAYPYTSDDPFTYKFVGDNIVEFDGVNNFRIQKNAVPGSSCKMEIYSYLDSAKPLTTITIQVVGETTEDFSSRSTNVYSWTFDNGVPTTTSGNIDLSDAGFGTGALEMSQDLVLDNTKYWSIEWEADGTDSGSMLASSSAEAAVKNSYGGNPDFVFIYYINDVGWKIFRDTVYTDFYWQTHTGTAITGKHTYKLECSDSLYKFSIDGEVVDTRELIEGHASYKEGSPYSGAGKFSDYWNLHYILGGINQNGLSGTKYGYKGDVSYVKITTNEANRKIMNINDFPYSSVSGSGTQDNPYVINAKVAAGTVVDSSSFVASTPKGTLMLSAEKFGGKALSAITCNAGTKTVYAMLGGSIASNSIFYKINLTVSSTPDEFPSNMYPKANSVLVDSGTEAKAAATGATLVRTVEGKSYNFVKGYNLFTTVSEALDVLQDNGTIIMMPGTYAESVTLDKSLTIIGPKAGVNPNTLGNAQLEAWTLSSDRSNEAGEALITGKWTLRNNCAKLKVDGVTITEKGGFANGRTADYAPFDITLDNLIIRDITGGDPLAFGESSNSQTAAVTGKLTVNNLRAYNNSRRLMLTALDDQTFNNCYFSGSNALDYHRVPGVKDGNTDHIASYTMDGCFFDSIDYKNFLTMALAKTYSGSIESYENVAFTFTNNTFLNCIDSSASTSCGMIYLLADDNYFTLDFENNFIYEDDASNSASDKAVIYGIGYAATAYNKDFNGCYTIKKNYFVSTVKDLPYVFSSITTSQKSHNNVCISGNYFEVAGAVADATVNSTTTTSTNNNPVSYSEYKYVSPDFTANDCLHSRTQIVHKTANCQQEGYEGEMCLVCGEGLFGEVIPKTDHIPGLWKETKAPTCTDAGVEQQQCVVCQTVLNERSIDALDHDEGEWRVTKESTCALRGSESRFCTRCNIVLETRPIALKEHSYVGTQTKAPSCTEEGVMTYECGVCHDTYTALIDKLAHTPGNWQQTSEPDCTHTGVEKKFCTVCQTELFSRTVSAKGHVPGQWVILKEATYQQAGLRQRECVVCHQIVDVEEIAKLTTGVAEIFEDVGLRDWYVKNGALDYVYQNGLFEGVEKTVFAPNDKMTRAMFVTVLGRLAGVTVNHKEATKFVDVKTNKWYTGYIKWAADNGIVTGTDASHFEPEANITREQICKMMVEYCRVAGVTLRNIKPAVIFKDANNISGWAKKYVARCQTAGLVNGDNGYFNPKGNATRAEVATILMNFNKNYPR